MTTETTDETASATQDDGPMLMVVTLKSGVQIRMQVEKFVITSNGLGQAVGLRWEGAESSLVSIEHLDFGEVAAVHAEWPTPIGGADDAG